ncbi:MAG TPA: hypothetical protein VJ725_21545 [Thermoanaerobaculia bacterium]|nr:hypothetical protein [Thermoanaerobaculia bacterium]
MNPEITSIDTPPPPASDVGLRRLQKVAEVELAGERFDIAKNGGFHLVRAGSLDAYGRPFATPVDVEDYLYDSGDGFVHAKAQALLDALGEALVKLQGQRDLRLGREGVEP